MRIKENVLLSEHTTIKLGGKVKYFIEAETPDEIKSAVELSRTKSLRLFILGGGSNLIFPDNDINAVVLKIGLKGIDFTENKIVVNAGEVWDEFVELSVSKGFQGVECLSGIPGLTGATPMQNVGAYGQEVSDVIESVNCIDLSNMNEITFSNEECLFAYRSSRFKTTDRNKFIITSVTFKLSRDKEPCILYKDIENSISEYTGYNSLSRNIKLLLVRNEVLKIRRKKSMVIDPEDPDSVSCGSFFMNPILSHSEFESFSNICKEKNLIPPFYKSNDSYKIPAAWLIENSGFKKGYSMNGAGISRSHPLALVNRGCNRNQLLELAGKIKSKVFELYGIQIFEEPVIIT